MPANFYLHSQNNMHIDKQARNFIVSGLMIVIVFAIWLSFAKFPDMIRSLGKKQVEIIGNIKGTQDMTQKNDQIFPPASQKQPLYQIRIGTVGISVEAAETPAEKAQGLSDRESLPQDQGLFFLFDELGQYRFWMKDMKFPIDIIWISSDKKVIDISENLLPETYPATFGPGMPAQYAVEVNAFFARNKGIRIGDDVDMSKIVR